MTDIVERLRFHGDLKRPAPELMLEAADEIERLRELLRRAGVPSAEMTMKVLDHIYGKKD